MIEYLLAIWGFTHILVSSKIMTGFRNWLLIKIPFIGEMLNCYQCTSFWVSMILYPVFDNLYLEIKQFYIYEKEFDIDFIIWAFIGSGVTSIISVALSYLIKKSK